MRARVAAWARRIIQHQPTRPAFAAGLRASVVTTLPVVAALVLARPALSWMAIGAWLVTLCDIGGAYSTRAGAMLAMTIGGALVRLVGGVVGPHFALAVLLMLVGGTGLSLLRVLGDASAKVGALLVILLALALGARSENLHAVAVEAWLVVAGGLASMTLALLFWGVHPYKPARFAVARGLDALADVVDDLRRLSLRESEKELWDAWIRSAPRRVRAAIEAARGALFATRRGRASGSTTGDRLQVVVEQTDRIFEAVIGLGDQLESRATRPEERAEDVDRSLADVTEELRRLAALTIDPHAPSPDADRPGASTRIDSTRATDPPSRGRIRGTLAVIFQSLETAAAALVILPSVAATAPRRDADRVDVSGAVRTALTTLRAHLTPESHAFRHAARVGITTATAMLVMALIPLPHGPWAVLAAAVCLQPSHAATLSRTAQRVAGTAAGAGLVALLTDLAPHPAAMSALIAVTIFAAVALMPLSYFYFAFFVTPAFVLFAELAERRQDLASARVLDTLIGGGLALVGVSVFWRRADDQQLRRELAAAVERERVFVRCALARLAGIDEVSPADLAEARRQVGLANNNADDTLQQLLAAGRDPHHEARGVVLTYLRRITARTISALARAIPFDPAQRPALLAFGQRVDASLAACRASLEEAAENLPRGRAAREDEAADEVLAISSPAEGLPEPLRRIEVLVGEMRRRLIRGS